MTRPTETPRGVGSRAPTRPTEQRGRGPPVPAGVGCGSLSIKSFKGLETIIYKTLIPRDLWSCVLPRWQFNVNV